MSTMPVDLLSPPTQPPLRHYRWLPTLAIEPGQVVARPVVGLTGVQETMYVAVGSTLSASTIAQMVVKGVECVAVFEPSADGFADEQESPAGFETRLQEIFGPTPDAACLALMQAVIAARNTLC
ncbi:hypothetical protein GALL_550170 [mine drainage metagenome]|uniref:Uncharacterized protein n=1 Tax=mine drainage metagenome TaxID=410659 RepID=A0A1J5NW49_9ZZZZ